MAKIHAAGGLVVRDGRVLVVHRPKYDDLSLPKGHLDAGEDFLDAALREVFEETGFRCEPAEELEPVRYVDRKGRDKLVRYWRMEVVGGDWTPNDEVDEVRWLAPAEAIGQLSYDTDRALVAALGVEIERKFLVDVLPDGLGDAPHRRLQQGYLVIGDVEVRLRREDDRTLLTIKAGRGLVRAEEELEIAPDRFERLWPLTEGRRVVKTRHLLGDGVELDVYEGELAPLAVAEIEFASTAAAQGWTPPDWLGAEVTDDPAYKNQALAR